MNIDARELAWAAGLFEGEGCFTIDQRPGHVFPAAQLTMTDKDTVERFQAAVGMGVITTRHRKKEGYKQYWRWHVGGYVKVQAVAAMLWFGLGARRKSRAREVLSGHKASVGRGGRNKTKTHCLHGHPFDEGNTYRYPGTSYRGCRTCIRERQRDYYAIKNGG